MSQTDPSLWMPPSTREPQGSLLADYRPLPRIHDELLTAEHALREHWRPLIDAFQRMGTDEVTRRFGFADRHLRDSGVVHRIYDARGGAERPLPLAHVPLVIAPSDWASVEAAVVQRAELLDRVLADVYGPQKLVSAGHLPAALIAGNPQFSRPVVGVEPAGRAHLHFYAVDLGRGPDGRWWVLRDLTESPSGAGYTIENRIALSRALPELYQPLHVRRLAGFFAAFRDALASRSPAGHRVGLLSAGSYNEAAFEHAFLARYLGFLLLEGEDLVVRDDKVYASTTTGLMPVDVLLRRLDTDFADPLTFNAASWIGTPGLAVAARARNVVLANALGSGVVQAAGVMGALPEIARILLGEDLKLPNVATWWCGRPEAQSVVLADLDKLVVGPAFGPVLPGLLDDGAVPIRDLAPERRAAIAEAIAARGIDFVAQEAVHLSTMPVWKDGKLDARPFMLRVFAARTEDGWSVLPGGFCQVSASVDPRAVSLQRGSSVADVWVLSDRAEQPITLLPAESSAIALRDRDVLPTRTAENLYWLGRYLERAENTTRLTRALASRLIGFDAESDAMIPFIATMLVEVNALPRPDSAEPVRTTDATVFGSLKDADAIGGVCRLLTNARDCAAKTRDQLSGDAWTVLSDLVDLVRRGPSDYPSTQEGLEHCHEILRLVSAFAGLANNSMNRLSGWHFLSLGSCIERAINITRLARTLGDTAAPPGGFEALLELADSQISFGTLYSNVPTKPQIVDLVVLDAHNPRSLAYQATCLEEHVKSLPEMRSRSRSSASRKLAITVAARVNVLAPSEVTDETLTRIVRELEALSDAVTADFFTHGQAERDI